MGLAVDGNETKVRVLLLLILGLGSLLIHGM